MEPVLADVALYHEISVAVGSSTETVCLFVALFCHPGGRKAEIPLHNSYQIKLLCGGSKVKFCLRCSCRRAWLDTRACGGFARDGSGDYEAMLHSSSGHQLSR